MGGGGGEEMGTETKKRKPASPCCEDAGVLQGCVCACVDVATGIVSRLTGPLHFRSPCSTSPRILLSMCVSFLACRFCL